MRNPQEQEDFERLLRALDTTVGFDSIPDVIFGMGMVLANPEWGRHAYKLLLGDMTDPPGIKGWPELVPFEHVSA